jgi:hypothetical protein
MEPMDIQTQARGTARQLVNLTRSGDLDTVSLIVRLLTAPSPPHREPLRHVLVELLDAATAMVLRQIGGTEHGCSIVLDLRKVDGSIVDIDQLCPEVRAVVRALLARAYHHPEDTEAQISLALAGESAGLTDGLTLVLMWTVSAMIWCEEHDEPAPSWLATTAA